MKNKEIFELTKNALLPFIQNNIQCFIIFGSRIRSITSTENSDLDVFYIVKSDSNSIEVNKKVSSFYKELNIVVDPFWYISDYFLYIVNKNIDYTLWYQIFRFGEILYIEDKLKIMMNNYFKDAIIADCCKKTIIFRKEKHKELLQSIVKNLDIILTEASILKYYKDNIMSNWDSFDSSIEINSNANIDCRMKGEIFYLRERIKRHIKVIKYKENYKIENDLSLIVRKIDRILSRVL